MAPQASISKTATISNLTCRMCMDEWTSHVDTQSHPDPQLSVPLVNVLGTIRPLIFMDSLLKDEIKSAEIICKFASSKWLIWNALDVRMPYKVVKVHRPWRRTTSWIQLSWTCQGCWIRGNGKRETKLGRDGKGRMAAYAAHCIPVPRELACRQRS